MSLLARVVSAVYRFAKSNKLGVVLFMALVVLMVLGTVFPQGDVPKSYIERFGEGKYAFARRFWLFDIFHSPPFLSLAALLGINLLLCSLDGLITRVLAKRPERLSSWDYTLPAERGKDFESFLRSARFKVKRHEGDMTAARGFQPRTVSVVYHFALLTVLGGLVLSALTKYDGDTELPIGESVTVPASRDGRSEMSLACDAFWMEFYKQNDKFFVKDYYASTSLSAGGRVRAKRTLEVNKPLVWGTRTVYLVDVVQELTLRLRRGSTDTTVVTRALSPITTPLLPEGAFLSFVRAGKVTDYGSGEALGETTSANVFLGSPRKGVKLGTLTLGETTEIEGTQVTFAALSQWPVVSYKGDLGVKFLYVGMAVFVIGLFVRVFYPTFRVVVRADGDVLRVGIRGTGLASSPGGLMERFERNVARAD